MRKTERKRFMAWTFVALFIVVSLVVFAKTNYFDNMYVEGDITLDGGITGDVVVTGSLSSTVPASYIALLGSVEVDVQTTSDTLLYTVPAGYSCVITKIVIRSANKSLDQDTDATSNIGFAAATDVVASGDISKVLTATTSWAELTIGTAPVIGTTTQALNWHTTTGCTTADSTLQCEVFGYLY